MLPISKKVRYFMILVRLFILVLLFFYSNGGTFAQQILFSRPQKITRKVEEFNIVGKNSEGVLLYRKGGKYNAVDAYNPATLALHWSKEVRLEHKSEVIDVVLLDDNLLLLYSTRIKRNTYVYARLTNAELIPIAEPILIDSLDRQGLTDVNYAVSVSQNKQFVSLLRFNYDFGGLRNMNQVLFSTDFSVIKNKSITIDAKQITTQHIVDNMGNVVIANYQLRSDFFRSLNQYKNVRLTMYDYRTDDLHLLEIEDEKNTFNDVQLGIDNLNGKAIVAGFFAEGNNDNTKGYLYAVIDLQKHSFDQKLLQLFDIEYIKSNNTKSTALNKNGITNLEARDLVIRKDGGILLMGEVSYENRTAIARNGFDPAGGMLGFATNYYYDDIFVFSINPNGSMLWSNIINKKQYSEEDRGTFSSFGVFNNRSSLDLLFNEEVSYNTRLSSSKISSDGKYKMVNLFSKQEMGLILSPRNGKQVSATEYVMPAFTRRNEFQLMLVR